MKIVVGLVGEKGSGKETFGDFFMETAKGQKIVRVRFSDILNETLKLWGIDRTRENLQKLAVIMDDGFKKGTLTHAIYERIHSLDADIVILDGVRWETDEKLIRSFPKNFLVYINADVDIRYERLKIRREKLDEAKTYEQFMEEEKAPNEVLIPAIGRRADFKVKNNGTFEDLKSEVKKFTSKFIIQPS
jgi:dephospho-CoA kinase